MSLVTGPLLPFAALIWPLLLAAAAALPPVRPRALWLLPAAPLPALALALAGTAGATEVPGLLLGTVLAADRGALLLVGVAAAIWGAAGVYACAYLRPARKPAVFAGFWCLTLAGNIGTFLAGDVVTFYVAFAAVSLAAYVLVVHDGTPEALRAGRIYLVLAVLGEACLLAAFTILAAAAGSLLVPDLAAALPGAAFGPLAALLLLVGFGIKAGLMPLHIWLPLAHPAAPTPASAVLSGAIVKAGIAGLILFVPAGQVAGAGTVVALGLAGAVAGALLGLAQARVKAVLAYSTVSQMSLLVALIAAGSAAAPYYAAHHGLAKAALFLAVGLMAASPPAWRGAVLAGAGLVALSVAGAPLTGGALAKSAGKAGLGDGLGLAITLTAVTTTLVLGRALVLLARETAPGRSPAGAAPPAGLLVPTAALGLAALVLPWLLWGAWSELPVGYPLRPANVLDAGWPVAAGAALLLAGGAFGRGGPRIPEGDLAAPLERAAVRLAGRAAAAGGPGRRTPRRARAAGRRAAAAVRDGAAAAEAGLLRWRWSGLLLLGLALAGLASLAG